MEEKERFWYGSEGRSQAKLPPIQYLTLLGSSVYLISDGTKLGKIEAINKDLIIIKRGHANVIRYYVRHNMLCRATGSKLCVDLTLDEASLYIRRAVPNPSNFITLGSYFPNPPFAFGD